MEMFYSLTSIVSTVGDNTIAVGDACGFGNFGNLFKYFGNDYAIVSVDTIDRGNVFFGDYENVNGGLGIDVVKSENIVVFIRFFGRDFSRNDFTENTHKLIPSLSFWVL